MPSIPFYPMYEAHWAEPRDLSGAGVVREHLERTGLDRAEALERAQSPEVRERLEADTKEAVERGVFGVPTIFVDDELFWGNDRFGRAQSDRLEKDRTPAADTAGSPRA